MNEEILFAAGERVRVIRSDRRTMSLSFDKDGGLLLRVPFFADSGRMQSFVSEHKGWIEKSRMKLEKTRTEAENAGGAYTPAELKSMADICTAWFPQRVEYWARVIGVSYTHLTLRPMTSRWGSCTDDGHLCFNLLLAWAPENVRDSVIIHELCHRLKMNHSDAFYNKVYRFCPDYDACCDWLKNTGRVLIQRLRDN